MSAGAETCHSMSVRATDRFTQNRPLGSSAHATDSQSPKVQRSSRTSLVGPDPATRSGGCALVGAGLAALTLCTGIRGKVIAAARQSLVLVVACGVFLGPRVGSERIRIEI